MRPLLAALLLAFTATLLADVVRPAPGFAWTAAGGSAQSLKSLRGQPVVLLIADSARNSRLRRQIEELENHYKILSAKRTVFAAALMSDEALLKSDIPFVLAQNGPAVRDAYGTLSRFNIVVIGPDGNIDAQSGDVLTGQRVEDIIVNSFVPQKSHRRTN